MKLPHSAGSSLPQHPVLGQIHYNTTESEFYVWDGVGWRGRQDQQQVFEKIEFTGEEVQGLTKEEILDILRDAKPELFI